MGKKSKDSINKPYEFAVKRRTPHYKGLRRAGNILFVLNLLGLIFSVVCSNLMYLVFYAANVYLSSELGYIAVIVVMVLLFLVPVMFWLASCRYQDGKLTTNFSDITIEFKRERIEIKYTDLSYIMRTKRRVKLEYTETVYERAFEFSKNEWLHTYRRILFFKTKEADELVDRVHTREREYYEYLKKKEEEEKKKESEKLEI